MRYLQESENTVATVCRHLIVAVCIFALWGCNGSRTEALESQVAELQTRVEQQSAILQTLQQSHDDHHAVLERLSSFEQVSFKVDNIRFDVVEKAFEPLVVGEADLTLAGDAKPELIFVEWAVTVHLKSGPLEPATYIQRVENGSATLRIVHPLPSHSISKKQIRLEIKPTGWYLAHVAKLAE